MNSLADCTSGDCPRQFLTYQPTLAGNAVLLSLFAALIPAIAVLGFKFRSSVFGTAVSTGLALEVLGYIGRLLLHSSPNSRGDFILFLLGTILGPTCVCGAMFLVVPRIVALYGEEFRTWRPTWYLFLFYALTTICLVLELAGILASTVQDDSDLIDIGVRILVVGLAFQLAALAIFVGHAILFAIALRTRRHALDPKFAAVYGSGYYKAFLTAFSTATFLLVLRTAYRIVEIAEGYMSSIAQDENLFLVLDGAMVLLAVILLAIFFPARVFGHYWPQTSTRRLSQTPPRPLRTTPVQLSSTRPSPTYDPRMSLKSTVASNSPRRIPPPPNRNMVDSEALW
ncbi:RTA1 like protein-domain-containing protein [Xylariomycetidae sp. FL0641]|nr:RTA1 like protein-domain-containing protein [Xylariomycetidae sp. FL0641]